MLDGMGRDEMRAADADRQAVADKLRGALDEGRLNLHEYDERLQQAYAAKTYGDLDGLLTDLPVATAALSEPATVVVHTGRATVEWLGHVWGSWASAVSITTAIWLVSCLAAQDLNYFWPVWVAGPWGVVLLWYSIGGLASGQPREMVEERERKALAKQRKRERKALAAEALGAEALGAEALGAEALGAEALGAEALSAETIAQREPKQQNRNTVA
jgi:Domain of unknown function (DUF1707)